MPLRCSTLGRSRQGDELDGLADGEAIDECFAAEDAGFAGLRGVVIEAPEVHGGGQRAECADAGVGEGLEVMLIVGVDVDQLVHGVLVAADHGAGDGCQGEEP